MRILITGKNGQLGKSIYKLVSEKKHDNWFIFTGRKELDFSDESNINHYFDNHDKFDIVINCAAYTAVDKAEEEQDLVNQVNNLAVKRLAQIVHEQQAILIHISTDYVFDGKSNKPYLEMDATNPINIYGKTKLAGEKALQEVMPTNAIIIRTSWVYSEYGNNFVDTMLKLGVKRSELNVVSDQIGSPTYAGDLAGAVLKIVDNTAHQNKLLKTNVYHYSGQGECSWFEFAKEIFRLSNISCKVNSVKSDFYPTVALRPKNTVLDKKKIIREFELEIPNWKNSLHDCIEGMLVS